MMHELLISCFWSWSPWSCAVFQPKWSKHGHVYKWKAAAEGIKRPKSLNWQKTGNRAGCHDHFTACGCCQQHLDEQASQLCSSLVALQQLWQKPYKGPDAENNIGWFWKSCMQGWRSLAEGLVGNSSKVHVDATARQNIGIGWFCKKPQITLKNPGEWSCMP